MMKSFRPFIFSGWSSLPPDPRKTSRSISPSLASTEALPAAPPPMLPPTTETVLAPSFRRYRTAASTSKWSGELEHFGISGTSRLPVAAKVDRQHAETFFLDRASACFFQLSLLKRPP